MIEPQSTRAATVTVVAAVVNRKGRYLVCQRPSHKRHGGMWEFPGGKLERGETILEAANRELREELGVEVTAVGECLFAVQDPGSAFEIHFYETCILGEPACHEHQALAWVTPVECAALSLAPSDRAFARLLVARAPSSG